MKKLFALLLAPVLALSLFVGMSFAQLSNNQNPYTNPSDEGGSKELAVVGSGTGQQDSFVNVVKGFINWVLGILALIALLILLYGGFQMVTSAGDEEKYKAGFTILKHAAMGLLLIGVAWFIVSIIFWLVNILTNGVQPAGTNA
jgi:hypothetical protein